MATIDYQLKLVQPDTDKSSIELRPNDDGAEIRMTVSDRFTTVAILLNSAEAEILGHFLLAFAKADK